MHCERPEIRKLETYDMVKRHGEHLLLEGGSTETSDLMSMVPMSLSSHLQTCHPSSCRLSDGVE